MQCSSIPVVRYVVVMCGESRENSGPGHVFLARFLETRAFPKRVLPIRGVARLLYRVAGSSDSGFVCEIWVVGGDAICERGRTVFRGREAVAADGRDRVDARRNWS